MFIQNEALGSKGGLRNQEWEVFKKMLAAPKVAEIRTEMAMQILAGF